MSRETKNFDNSVNVGGLAEHGSSIIANLELAGQTGYSLKPGMLDAATPLVLPPAVIYVTQTPHMWDIYEDDQALARVVKSMFETHAKSVTGIDIGYTLESAEQPVGLDGQQMSAPTVSKRNAVNPNFTWGEVTGNLIYRVIQTWLWDVCDPDTQISMARLDVGDLIPFTMSAYALSFIALQFDQTMDYNRLLGAIYITNVYPQGTNEYGLKREIGQASTQDRSISFNGLAIENSYIYGLGKRIGKLLAYRDGYASAVTDPYSASQDVTDGAGIGLNSSLLGAGAMGGGIADETNGAEATGLKLSDQPGAAFQGKSPAGDAV